MSGTRHWGLAERFALIFLLLSVLLFLLLAFSEIAELADWNEEKIKEVGEVISALSIIAFYLLISSMVHSMSRFVESLGYDGEMVSVITYCIAIVGVIAFAVSQTTYSGDLVYQAAGMVSVVFGIKAIEPYLSGILAKRLTTGGDAA